MSGWITVALLSLMALFGSLLLVGSPSLADTTMCQGNEPTSSFCETGYFQPGAAGYLERVRRIGFVPENCSTGFDEPKGSLSVTGTEREPYGGSAVRSYSIEVEDGVALDPECLAETVERVLGDSRSWIAGSDLGWQQVTDHPDMRIIFASPNLTDRICFPLRTGGIYSCREGRSVVLNVTRWRKGAKAFPDLNVYRVYQINHEVGHYLGNGHRGCPKAGVLAPVMMQQTKGVGSCQPNGWPYP